MVEITDAETARKATNLLNALEDLDDVTSVHSNAEIVE
jgi:transcriptional/translational regulatory protein YebC/TACO1